MEILIAIGQGAGLAAACGLAAILPIGVLALAALLGWTPGGLAFAAEAPFALAAWAAGIAEAAARAVLPAQVRIGLSAAGGGAAFEIAAGDRIPFAGLVVGAVIGAAAALVATTMSDRALAAGGTRWGIAAVVAVVAVAAAALAIVPFAGFALVAVGVWLGLRLRRERGQRYEGLRVLR